MDAYNLPRYVPYGTTHTGLGKTLVYKLLGGEKGNPGQARYTLLWDIVDFRGSEEDLCRDRSVSTSTSKPTFPPPRILSIAWRFIASQWWCLAVLLKTQRLWSHKMSFQKKLPRERKKNIAGFVSTRIHPWRVREGSSDVFQYFYVLWILL